MKGIFFIITACLLWAVDTLVRYPLIWNGISAKKIVFAEHIILSLVFLPLLFKGKRKIWNARVGDLFYFLVIGGLGSAIGTLAFTKAFSLINPSLVILLQKLQPLVAITMARLVLGERISKTFILWAIFCLIGGGLISFKDIYGGLSTINFDLSLIEEKALLGYGLTLLAVFSWGVSTVFGKKLEIKGYSELEVMGGRFIMGFLCLAPLFSQTQFNPELSLENWGKVGIMVVLSGLVGMYLYYRGLKQVSARLCALAEMFFPFCAIAVNWVFLGKTLDPLQLVGGAVLLVGSTVIELKKY